MKASKWLIPVLLLALFAVASGFKIHRAFLNPLIKKESDSGSFWTENAIHYRWAKMEAEGKGIPKWDRPIQYPEGIYPFEEETPVMEVLAGKSYRWLGLEIPFHHYIVIFSCVFSSLSIFPLFGTAYILSRKTLISFICAVIFAFSIANISSVAVGSIPRENFALPLIFFHFWFLVVSLKRKEINFAILSGLFLFMALSSWHLTQFYYGLLLIFFVLVYLGSPQKSILTRSFVIVSVFALLAGISIPVLIKGGFLISYASLISISFLIAVLAFPKKWSPLFKRTAFLGLTVVLCSLPYLFQASHLQEFSHVYQFLKSKILYLGQKPDNPALLPYEAKVMWMSSFMTPSWKTVWDFFILIPILALPGIGFTFLGAIRRTLTAEKALTGYFVVVFGLMYWLMIRMDCFWVFFLTAIIAVPPDFKFKKVYAPVFSVLLICALSFNLYKLHHSHIRSVTPPLASIFDIMQKVLDFTGPEDPVLTPFALGPSIAAFTGRPIILHSKFENKKVRDKVRECEEGLFKSEEELYQICVKYGARYFILDTGMMLDLSKESLRYRTNQLPASRQTALFKLHFAPEKLKHFKLIGSNEDFRLFRVLKPEESRRIFVPVQPAVYDLRNFSAKELQLSD